MIIDFYTQTGPSLSNFEKRLVRPLSDTSDPLLLIDAMDAQDVTRSVVFAPRWVGGDIIDPTYSEANAAIAIAVASHPERLVGFGRVNPNYGAKAIAEVEKGFEEHGFRGLILDPEWENFDPTDRELAFPIYEVALEKKAPIIFHTWYSPSQPALYWEVAENFPGIPIIISHLGGRLIADALCVAQHCSNVYLETSDNMYGLSAPVRALGPERILFGSNTPFSSMETELLKVTSAKLPAEQQDLILGGNAKRLIG